MKILVTGATGFIGRYVVDQLLQRNIEVVTTGRKPVNQLGVNNLFIEKRTTYLQFDIDNYDRAIDLFKFFGNPDAVIHLAWSGLPDYQSDRHLDNVKQHYLFLHDLIHNGLKNLTVSGTCFEYGKQNGCLSETDAWYDKAVTNYGLAKKRLFKKIQKLFVYALPVVQPYNFKWMRIFYTYGDGQNKNSLIPQLQQAILNKEKIFNLSGGKQVRDYLAVKKVAEYIVLAALQDKVTGAINCCSGTPITVQKLVTDYLIDNNESIKLNFGYYPYSTYEPMEFWGNTQKLKSIAGYKF